MAIFEQLLGVGGLSKREHTAYVHFDAAFIDQFGDGVEIGGTRLGEHAGDPHSAVGKSFFVFCLECGDQNATGTKHFQGALLCVAANGVKHDIQVADMVLEAWYMVVDRFVGAQLAHKIQVVF